MKGENKIKGKTNNELLELDQSSLGVKKLSNRINLVWSKREETEALYRNLVELANDMVYTVDLAGNFLFVNPAFEKNLGYAGGEIKKINGYSLVHPEDLKKAKEQFTKLINGENVNNLECRYKKKDNSYINVLNNAVPLFDSNKRVIAVFGIARDITAFKKVEQEIRNSNEELEKRVNERTVELEQAYRQLKSARQQFYQAQKMESIGMLAGGIAHDFNNLLATIVGNISLAKMMLKPEDKIYTILTRAEKISLKAKDLTQQLLTFSRGGAPIKKIISIQQIIRDSVNITTRGSKVNYEFSLPDNIWPVEVDEGQLLQVINNMIINADQAMAEGGIIKVWAENIRIDTDNDLQLPEGTYVRISIQDQGIGISEENLAKVFDPFFTTKPEGTGLGLTTAYSIIKKHNGLIKVDSKIGIGTTFQIYLPASHKEILVSRKINQKLEEPIRKNGKGRILVMDDEDAVRETAKDILVYFGYEVGCARDGTETINHYRKAKESGRPFDLVIIDLTIKGGMGGKETLDELIKIDPNVKSIVSSGYSNDPIMADFKNHGFSGFVAKPYKVEELIKALNQVLPD